MDKICEYVKQNLSEKRYYHSVCVMKKCEELAKHFGENIEEAKKVGLIHDIAKELSDEEKLSYAKENDIEIDPVELKHPGLLHGKIGADIAKKKFGFSEKMCQAIKYHTTGGKNMSILDKILYVADAIRRR